MKNIVLLVASIIVGVLLLEAGLRIFTPFPINKTSNRVHDPTIGYRLSTGVEDIDENGFRNIKGKKYYIAAVGDSLTYSYNVSAVKSWPSQLESMLDIGVYNFGVGSYGIFSYHAIIKTLLHPDTQGIIVGLYTANDLSLGWSNCQIDYANDPFWQKEVISLNLKLPAVKRCKDRQLKQIFKNIRNRNDLKKFLYENIAFINAFDLLVYSKIKQIPVRKNNSRKYYYFPDGIDPILKRHLGRNAKMVDLRNPNIATMYENMGKLIENWSTWSKSENKKLGLMFIPSTGRVVYEYFKSKDKLNSIDPEFIDRVKMEINMEEKISRLLDQSKIPHKNALEKTLIALQNALQEGTEFYPLNNSHPLEDGYRAYAKTASELWIEMNQK